MDIPKAEQTTFFSQPIRQIVTMLLAVALVARGRLADPRHRRWASSPPTRC